MRLRALRSGKAIDPAPDGTYATYGTYGLKLFGDPNADTPKRPHSDTLLEPLPMPNQSVTLFVYEY